MKIMCDMEKVGYLHELDLLIEQAQETIIKTPTDIWKQRGHNFRVKLGLQGFPFFFDSLGVYEDEKTLSEANAGVKIYSANPDLVMALYLQLWLIIDAANLSQKMDFFSDIVRSLVLTAEGYILGIENDIEVKPSPQIEDELVLEFMPGLSNSIKSEINKLIHNSTSAHFPNEAHNENV